jgi:hypothetical protein
MTGLQQGFTAFGMGFAINLRCKNPKQPMSLMGHSRPPPPVGLDGLCPLCSESDLISPQQQNDAMSQQATFCIAVKSPAIRSPHRQ